MYVYRLCHLDRDDLYIYALHLLQRGNLSATITMSSSISNTLTLSLDIP